MSQQKNELFEITFELVQIEEKIFNEEIALVSVHFKEILENIVKEEKD